MTEGAIDELLTAVGEIGAAEVHNRARDALARLHKATSFGSMLQQGMHLPKSGQTNFATIEAAVPEDNGQTAKKGVIGLIARNPSMLDQTAKNGALVLVINDLVVAQPATGNLDAESSDKPAPDAPG